MKPERCVVVPYGYNSGGPLYLKDCTYKEDGSLETGYVINGAWHFEIRGDEWLAKAGNSIVSRWPAPSYHMVPVSKYASDYNRVISWAMNQVESKGVEVH